MKNNIKWKKWSRNANGKQTHLSSNTALSYKNNQSTKTACSASKNRKLKREREENTAGVLVYTAFLKGQDNAENLHKMIKLFKFHRN